MVIVQKFLTVYPQRHILTNFSCRFLLLFATVPSCILFISLRLSGLLCTSRLGGSAGGLLVVRGTVCHLPSPLSLCLLSASSSIGRSVSNSSSFHLRKPLTPAPSGTTSSNKGQNEGLIGLLGREAGTDTVRMMQDSTAQTCFCAHIRTLWGFEDCISLGALLCAPGRILARY